MTISLEQSFWFAFKDKDWVSKLTILSVFSLLSVLLIGVPFCAGYLVRLVRMRLNKEGGLPGWENAGELCMDGLKALLLCMAFSLPIILVLLVIFVCLLVVSMFDSNIVALLVLPLVLLFQFVIILYSFFIAVVQPWIYYVVANRLPLSEVFQLRPYLSALRKDTATLLIGLILIWFLGSISGIALLFFLVGIFFAAAYVGVFTADLHGRLLAEWKQRGWLPDSTPLTSTPS